IFTECTERSFQTLDVTMVIRPEEVDKSVKAALHLVIMIGDVRHEVSVCTVALAEHAVLVITEIRRPEPQGIVLLECIAIILHLAERFLYLPLFLERSFTEPVVKMHIEIRTVLAEFLHFIIHTELTEFRHTLFVR